MSRWQLSACSHRGPRPENQDNYLLVYPNGTCKYLMDEQEQVGCIDGWQEDHVRVAVVDGMGGHQNGRVFAENVVLELQKIPFQQKPQAMRDALLGLHEQLFEHYYRGSRSPGSTLVMADISPEGIALIANIGDSRAYLLDAASKLDSSAPTTEGKQLTYDQTQTEFAWRDGLITDETYYRENQRRGKIAQALGFGCSRLVKNGKTATMLRHTKELVLDIDTKHPDILKVSLPINKKLLLASDGLWNRRKAEDSGWVLVDNVTMLTSSSH